jgi:2-polyprenyl-6-methoxyphenol hydroxylase-like FAD-dependent oxidoreductase
MSLRVAIVGCGTAGAAAALFLARAGHTVTVFERVADPRPVGAGITLQPTGQAVLARLGLLAAVVTHGARVDRLHAQTATGRTLVDLRYADVDPTLFGLGVHRGALFSTLFAAVQGEPGVTLHLGVEMVGVTSRGTERWLRSTQDEHGPFDLVVVADGSISELHASAGVPYRNEPYPWGALWFVAKDADDRAGTTIDQLVDGPQRLCGILPTGLPPGGEHRCASLFWSLRADRVDAWRAAGLESWKSEVRALHPRTAPLLDQVDDLDEVLFTRYRDVSMPRWHGEGVVFLGDAAHATSPQLGQGANLALWDAMVLADVLAGGGSIADYTKLRRGHLGYYQFATRALTPVFQGDLRLVGWLRDLVFPWSAWLAPLRWRMVRTMMGVDTGVLWGAIPLSEVRGLIEGPRG